LSGGVSMVKIRNIFVWVLMISISASNVIADGNITTDSGDLYLQPNSGYTTVMSDTENYTSIHSCDLQGAGSTAGMCYDVGGSPGGNHYFSNAQSNAFFRLIAGDNDRAGLSGFSGDGERFVALKYNTTQNAGMFYFATTDGAIVFNPRTGGGGSVRPYSNKEDDLGTASYSWDDCYCNNYRTTSRGYSGTPEEALAAVIRIETLPNGEINHSSVDSSLGDDETISTNAVTFANSKAIFALLERIEKLESRIKELEDKC
jgi:hypothetical protein